MDNPVLFLEHVVDGVEPLGPRELRIKIQILDYHRGHLADPLEGIDPVAPLFVSFKHGLAALFIVGHKAFRSHELCTLSSSLREHPSSIEARLETIHER